MKVTVRASGETVTWIDDSIDSDERRENLLCWLREQFYDRAVRDIHVDINYLGPLQLRSVTHLRA